MSELERAARQVVELSTRVEQDSEEYLGEDGMVIVVPLDTYNDMMESITALREALEQLNCQCGDKCFPVFSGDIEYCETCGKPTALAEQVHTPYCKQAPMCKTPCGNSDCVEQAEQEPVACVKCNAEVPLYKNGMCEVCDFYCKQAEQEPVAIGSEWKPCMKLPVVVHVREQREGESHVSTREGITPVRPDDLIMRGVAGEEYPIGRELFNKTYTFDTAAPVQQAEQEPVAWTATRLWDRKDTWKCPADIEKDLFYAAPVRTKDLTDDEIMKINVDTAGIVPTCDRQFHFARAVIAADREKNK